MRNLQRRAIGAKPTAYLTRKTLIINGASLIERPDLARRIYKAARTTKAFGQVVDALKTASGSSLLCMYCSSNESAQLEHFWPLSIYPSKAMDYSNYLWSCDICNRRHKGILFPLDALGNPLLLNPFDDNVWDHFFIDSTFGRLIPKTDGNGVLFPRAVVTDMVVKNEREVLQMRRQRRFAEMCAQFNQAINDYRAGTTNLDALSNLVNDWRSDLFQADVADYFLNGPGRVKAPFSVVLALLP